MMRFKSGSAEQTREFGRRLGGELQAGDVLLLRGELGSGKTVLVQGIAEGLGIDQRIPSPTFTLINEYAGRLPLYHCDFYRLQTQEELQELGLEDYLYGDGVTAIEWPERMGKLMPEDHLEIVMEPVPACGGPGCTQRFISLIPHGERYERLAARDAYTGDR